MRSDAHARVRYLRQTIDALFPGSGGYRPYTLLPHPALPRRLAPRRWWHAALGPRLMLPVEDSIESHLGEVLGARVRAVLHARPARRANRKPVLEVRDGRGLLAYAKIGDTPRARELVQAEAAALAALADRPLKTVMPPTVLHHGSWRGLEVLVLSPLPARSGKVPERLLVEAVKEIAGDGEPYAWHGDLTPWNIAPSADGRLLVWDWERYGTGVPYGFDALHHLFHRCLRRMDPATAARACLARAPRTMAEFGLSAHEARRAALHYLITLADRHAADGHEPLGPTGRWLTPLVDYEESLV
ncbi:hypothetical protein [Thermoactinospora rubra]|uniref:hypothetical protein n=1 Tax=Thermoactinospora rubra TaxID=1088767 RepID=UPI000A11E7E2|nr:hypothetical protein [Thermoactinospora rubra]